MTPDPWCTATRHGNVVNDYWRGCRCTPARAAECAYRARTGQWIHLGSSVGVRRRLQALAAIGWAAPDLAARLGVVPQQIQKWRSRDATVYPETATRIARLYDELSMTAGPSTITRKRAATYGWAPPLAWDDDLLDDPTAEPQGIHVGAPRVGRFDVEDAELLIDDGGTWETVAARLGVAPKSLDRRLRRAGRLDLIAKVARNSERQQVYRNQWSA